MHHQRAEQSLAGWITLASVRCNLSDVLEPFTDKVARKASCYAVAWSYTRHRRRQRSPKLRQTGSDGEKDEKKEICRAAPPSPSWTLCPARFLTPPSALSTVSKGRFSSEGARLLLWTCRISRLNLTPAEFPLGRLEGANSGLCKELNSSFKLYDVFNPLNFTLTSSPNTRDWGGLAKSLFPEVTSSPN